ncbi:MAG: DUF501 domain-containing protein [Acidimicrobiales bacterium]|nr:DUF501 domain-containing protein [Acidimicrobiales bacterium]
MDLSISKSDEHEVARLLKREPSGNYKIVVRAKGSNRPVVIQNHPYLFDGTPMPTTYWLIGDKEARDVAKLESEGGVKQAERDLDPHDLELAHRIYANRRAFLTSEYDVKPEGGVGGTRKGVKCLHAHLANYLAGNFDPVGKYCCNKVGIKPEDYLVFTEREILGIIDCGTNSTRFLIAEKYRDSSFVPLLRKSQVTKLGEGVDSNLVLNENAMDRTLQAVRNYKLLGEKLGVERWVVGATSAVRDSANAYILLSELGNTIHSNVNVLSGELEARLTFLGATHCLESQSNEIVVDIGGGSTEFVMGVNRDIESLVGGSVNIGVVRIMERFLESDPPTKVQLDLALKYVRELTDVISTRLSNRGNLPKRVIGVGGTPVSLAHLSHWKAVDLARSVHHFEITRDQVQRLFDQMKVLNLKEREKFTGMEAGRAEVIVAGTIELLSTMTSLGIETCLVSEADLLDGMGIFIST